MKSFTPYGGDYHVGHPWYYKLGGRAHTPKEIREDARIRALDGHFANGFAHLDRKKEPARSDAIEKERSEIKANITERISRYREVVRELHRLRTFIGPEPYDWFKHVLNDTNQAVGLVHAHISYHYAYLHALNALDQQQGLFGSGPMPDAITPEKTRIRSEMTDAGEQTVIPGCELDAAETGAKQMSLF